jgi:cytochrome c oxidase subunit 1
MEKSYREKGGKGLFSWIKHLPWKDSVFAGIAFSMILFAFGGIGGIINASYTLNALVHNTTWIVGHFHLTVATAVTLTFMVSSYVIIPALFNKAVMFRRLAFVHPYLWFIGMSIFSLAFHIAGLYGMPRRTADILYGGAAPQIWITLAITAAIGGIILWLSGVIFIFNAGLSIIKGPRMAMDAGSLFEHNSNDPTILDKISIWVILAVAIIVIAYILPFMQIYSRGLSPAPPVPP